MFGSASKQGSLSDSAVRSATFETEAMPHVSSLFRVALWLTRDRAESEDLVQETLMEALSSFHRFAQARTVEPGSFSILYHMQSKRRRTAARLHLVSDAENVSLRPQLLNRRRRRI